MQRLSRATYGPVRVQRALAQRGTKCHRQTVAKVIIAARIRSKSSRKLRVTTTDSNHTQSVAENVLARDFTAEKVNQKWVSDMTYLATLEGWLYLAVVLDLFTRKVVGWSMRMGSPISMPPGVIPTSRNFSEMVQHCRKFKNWPATPTSI